MSEKEYDEKIAAPPKEEEQGTGTPPTETPPAETQGEPSEPSDTPPGA